MEKRVKADDRVPDISSSAPYSLNSPALSPQNQSLRRFGVRNLLWGLFGIGLLTALILGGRFHFENWVLTWGFAYDHWLTHQDFQHPLIWIPVAFLGGVLASISPCILGLLPVNLTYIGTLQVTSPWNALGRSTSFVAGVITTLSLLGLIASLAQGVWITYRGYVSLGAGIFIVAMGLVLMEKLPFPLIRFPRFSGNLFRGNLSGSNLSGGSLFSRNVSLLGPFGVGLGFALLSSPCSSPVLLTMLAIASSTASRLDSILIMISYAIGYTSILFIASLFTGLAKQTSKFLPYSAQITHWSSMVLVGLGCYYIYDGLTWWIALARLQG